MRKALTPIISVVLLILLVTVSAGGALLFITQVMGNLEESAGEAVSELPACSQVSIPVAYGDGFVLTNTGCDSISNVTVLVDGELVNVLLSEPLPEGDSTYVSFPENVTLYNDQDHLYKVALNNGFSTTKRIQEETASSTSGFYGRCEENQTSCTTDVFFTGDIVANDYPTCSCCGDDNNEYFYNGSISSTHYFCHDSQYYNTTIDTNEELCTYYDHEWVSNSGEYEATESFDYETQKGLYYGTYDFRDEVRERGTDISFVNSTGSFDSVRVIDNYRGHNYVLTAATTDEDYSRLINYFDTAQSSGTIELYGYVSNDWARFRLYPLEGGYKLDIRIYEDRMRVQHGDGEGSYEYTNYYFNTDFPHFKLTFDCTTDTFSVWCEGTRVVSDVTFINDGVCDKFARLDILGFTTQVFFDAIGYSWDSTSHNGLGYSEGWNTNSYDIVPLLENYNMEYGFETDYGQQVFVESEVDNHKNVLKFADNMNDNNYRIRTYTQFESEQSEGAIEFWWRYTSSASYTGIALTTKKGWGNLAGFDMYLGGNGGDEIDNIDPDGNFDNLVTGLSPNTWYHIKIDFDCSTDTYNFYLNGILEKSDVEMRRPTDAINILRISESSGDSGHYHYFDAFSYSWDSSYHVGDNFVQYGCCGDDKISDEFYNIASNETFCYEGVKTTNVDETKQEWCELDQYNVWFSGSNSGSDSPCCGDDGYNLRDGLVSHWKFDESSGSTASDSIGSNDGTLTNMDDSDWVNGKHRNALDFDGTDDYVRVSNSESLNPESEIAVAGWLYCKGGTASQHAISKTFSNSFLQYEISYSSGSIYWAVGDGGENGLAVSESISLKEWVNVVGTFDASNNTLTLYIDGEKAKEINDFTSAMSDNGYYLAIGSRRGGYGEFNGTIDDVRVYNRSLSSREVQKLYNNTASEYVSEGDNFYNGTLGSTRHVCYYGEETILDDNKYACEYYDYEWMSNSSAHYPGTYSFTNDPVATYTNGDETEVKDNIEFISSNPTIYADQYIKILAEHEGHKQVLQLLAEDGDIDNRIHAYHNLDSAVSDGIIELYVWLNGTANVGDSFNIFLYEDGSLFIRFRFDYGAPGRIVCGDGEIDTVSQEEWHHIKIVLDDTNDQFEFFTNGDSKGTFNYEISTTTGVDQILLRARGGSYSDYRIDAVGYSWDTDYSEGDNLYFTNYLGTETFEEYNQTEAGEYYGTYDFNDETVGTTGTDIGFVDIETMDTCEIVESYNGHNNVLHFDQNSGNGEIYNYFDSGQTSGTIEWWANNAGGYYFYMNLRDQSNNHPIKILFKSATEIRILYGDGAGDSTYQSVSVTEDEWVHIKVEFDCSTDKQTVWINDIKEVDNENFYDDIDSTEIKKFKVYNHEQSGYLDTIGYLWDPDYSEGDNINSHGKEVVTALENNNWTVNSLDPHTSVAVSGEFNEHKKVLNLTDNSDSARVSILNSFSQSSGSIEYWIKTTDASYSTTMFVGSYKQANFRIDQDLFRYWDGSYQDITTATDNSWYHIKIAFECSSGKYMGLNEDSWRVWINGKEYGDYSFNTAINSLDDIEISTATSDSKYSAYLDSLSFSWDSDYQVGDNKIAPRCFGDDSGEVSSVLSTI